MANLKVNGQWFTDYGAFGELQWSSRHRGGCDAASWRVDSTKRLPFRPGQLVEVIQDGWPVFAGTLLEPDGDTMHSRGLYYQGDTAFALDTSGNATVNPDMALYAATFTRGRLDWVQPVSLLNADFGEVSTPSTVNALLTSWAESVGKVIRVDGRRRVTAETPAITPRWFVAPGAADLAVADDSFASSLALRYLDSTSSAWTSVTVSNGPAADRFGPRETVETMPDDAPSISAAQATLIAQTRLTELSRPGWANPMRLASWELTSSGDAPANLRAVMGGDMVRIQGQMDPTIASGPQPYIDVIADEVSYVDGSDFVDIKPVGYQPRSFTDVLAAALG